MSLDLYVTLSFPNVNNRDLENNDQIKTFRKGVDFVAQHVQEHNLPFNHHFIAFPERICFILA